MIGARETRWRVVFVARRRPWNLRKIGETVTKRGNSLKEDRDLEPVLQGAR